MVVKRPRSGAKDGTVRECRRQLMLTDGEIKDDVTDELRWIPS